MKKRVLAAAVALIMVLTAVMPASYAAETERVCYDVTYHQTEARRMTAMVNDFRTGDEAWIWNSSNTETVYCSGLGALKYDYALEKIAMQRCAEIAIAYSHTRPNGGSCFTAHRDEDYSYWAAGENIAWGYNCLTDAEEAFLLWREDDCVYSGQGHRRNMLGSDYTAFAAACCYYGGVWFWVQEFAYHNGTVAAIPANDSLTRVESVVDAGLVASVDIGIEPGPVTLQKGESYALPEFSCELKLVSTCRCAVTYIDPSCVSVTSADPGVASVSNGVVTAKKRGSTVVTIALLGEKKTFTVTVEDTSLPAAPAKPEAVNKSGGVRLTWNAAEGAEHYEVLRAVYGSADYACLGQATGLSYTDPSAVNGMTYTYRVRAVNGNGTGESSAGVHIRFLSMPKNVTCGAAEGGIRIGWDAVSGASGYYVYRRAEGASSWTKCNTVTGGTKTSALNTSIRDKAGTYYYTVQAFYATASGTVYTSSRAVNGTKIDYDPARAEDVPAAAEKPELMNKSAGVKVSWQAAENASAYEVWRTVYGKNSFTKVGTFTGLSCTDAAAKSGTTYSYRVRAVNAGGSGPWSPLSHIRFLDMPEVYAATGYTMRGGALYPTADISWNAVSGASGYLVYRRAPGDSSWTLAGDIPGDTSYYIGTGVTEGERCYFTVQAYYTTSSGTVYKSSRATTGVCLVVGE